MNAQHPHRGAPQNRRSSRCGPAARGGCAGSARNAAAKPPVEPPRTLSSAHEPRQSTKIGVGSRWARRRLGRWEFVVRTADVYHGWRGPRCVAPLNRHERPTSAHERGRRAVHRDAGGADAPGSRRRGARAGGGRIRRTRRPAGRTRAGRTPTNPTASRPPPDKRPTASRPGAGSGRTRTLDGQPALCRLAVGGGVSCSPMWSRSPRRRSSCPLGASSCRR